MSSVSLNKLTPGCFSPNLHRPPKLCRMKRGLYKSYGKVSEPSKLLYEHTLHNGDLNLILLSLTITSIIFTLTYCQKCWIQCPKWNPRYDNKVKLSFIKECIIKITLIGIKC